jgi:hypothetical protein
MVELVRAGLATAYSERVVAVSKTIMVTRLPTADASRHGTWPRACAVPNSAATMLAA